MTDRCEPPPELRDRDGWHWVEAPAIKMLFIRRWWRARGEWCWADIDERTLRSFRYLSPVLTPAEAAALRAERDEAVGALEGIAKSAAEDLRQRNAALDEAETLRANNARLREALDFYGCADHYPVHGAEAPDVVRNDGGQRARAALAQEDKA